MTRDRMIEYYRKRAGEYDKIYFRDDPVRQSELSDLYQLSRETLSQKSILDIACGTGFWTRIVSESTQQVFGMDINRQTLIEAGQKSYKCPVSLIEADIYNLPIIENRLDGLLATYIVSHVKRQDLEALGQSLKSCLKPGSIAFICDNNLICEIHNKVEYDKEKINSYSQRRLENGEEYLILKNYFEEGELADIFGRWGNLGTIVFRKYYWAVLLTF